MHFMIIATNSITIDLIKIFNYKDYSQKVSKNLLYKKQQVAWSVGYYIILLHVLCVCLGGSALCFSVNLQRW